MTLEEHEEAIMSDDLELAEVRAIIVDDERRLALMRRNGVSEERITSLRSNVEGWKRRQKNLEAANR
jgi:hypothetical protein